jgi:hypothetical protein
LMMLLPWHTIHPTGSNLTSWFEACPFGTAVT